MAPTASIIVPTRERPAYLAVALASMAPQAAAAGAEVLVVDDGPPATAAATRALAARHGARYLANDAGAGPNGARNAGIAAAAGDLLVLVDDDVEAPPGWLGALLAAAAADPAAEVLGGPIRARLEGARLRTCGREGAPITFLDLGTEDRDADFVWSANMAIRRAALERVGRFDPTLGIYGDEEEWQRRHKAAGGRIRYVAAAGLDHRRSGADARLGALARSAYRRGRASRRYDVRKGTQPGVAGELRVLAGSAWHAGRRACAMGILSAAHSAGRVRTAIAPGPPPPAVAGVDDFLSGQSGTVGGRRAVLRWAGDRILDAAEALALRPPRLARAAASEPPRRRVLVLAVARPERAGTMEAALRELARSRHDVTLRTTPPGGRGKFENLDQLLAANPTDPYDWLIVVDDDVHLPRGFLDRFLFLAERYGLRLAQPAHRLTSHAAWPVTRRRRSSVRETSFVEIGPVTAFHRDVFAAFLPFPASLRMGWGLDVHWAAVARERGWPIGVVDATPVEHALAPAAAAYSREAAVQEARAFLRDRPYVTRAEAERTLAAHRGWSRPRARA